MDVQKRLIELGYSEVTLDGDFGPTTERTVKAFQEYYGLKVDGRVGPHTWAALFPR
jgi:peptidoglycan hydrolase-like protein with peptidoglycan-binding domain